MVSSKSSRSGRKIWDEALTDIKSQLVGNINYLLSNPMLDIYLRNIPVKEGQKILEPGAGSGLDSLLCAKKYGIEPYLLDFSESSLNMVRDFGNMLDVKYNFILGDCKNLPFQDNSFDIVWNNGVNEHFDGDNRQGIFDEMARVCKKEGYVLIVVPNAWNLFYRLKKKIMELRGDWPFGFEKPFSPIELTKRVKKAGLKVIRYDACGLLSSIFDFFKFAFNSFISSKEIQVDDNYQTADESLLIKIARKINRAKWINYFFGSLIVVLGKKE